MPANVPIEGEWYTTTYRNGVVGWPDSRTLDDARTVRYQGGSDRLVSKPGTPIKYAGVMVQYFASVLAIDNIQPPGQAERLSSNTSASRPRGRRMKRVSSTRPSSTT